MSALYHRGSDHSPDHSAVLLQHQIHSWRELRTSGRTDGRYNPPQPDTFHQGVRLMLRMPKTAEV